MVPFVDDLVRLLLLQTLDLSDCDVANTVSVNLDMNVSTMEKKESKKPIRHANVVSQKYGMQNFVLEVIFLRTC